MVFQRFKSTPIQLGWVLPGRLAVGEAPQAHWIPALQEAEVQAILGLCAETEVPWPKDLSKHFHCQRFVLPDSHYSEPLTVEQLATAVQMLKELLDQDLVTYIHCQAGVERSPTVCLAYLGRYHRLPVLDALQWIKKVNPRTAPIPQQVETVKAYLAQA
ncbi:MAG: dual specificity protein phosphatase [Thermostichales cyanobacterium HHBFW_bins_127]